MIGSYLKCGSKDHMNKDCLERRESSQAQTTTPTQAQPDAHGRGRGRGSEARSGGQRTLAQTIVTQEQESGGLARVYAIREPHEQSATDVITSTFTL